MNKKTIAILIIIFITVFVSLYLWFDLTKPIEKGVSTASEEIDSPVVVTPNIENIDLSEPDSPPNKGTNDIKIIASSPEEAEKLAKDFYKDMFSVVTVEDNYISDVYSGESINVNNFYSETEPPSQFVPLFSNSNSKVVGVSIFREYTKGQKELGRMSEITAEWYSYPPISSQEAEHGLISANPSLYYEAISGYYFIEDGETPYYLFKNNTDSEQKYFLVSAYDKNIITKNSRLLNKAHQEKPPVKLDANGLMEVDMKIASNLSKEELEKLKSDIELTNKYIRDGTMRFDENMNVIYDERENSPKDIFSKEGANQNYYNYDTSDDNTMTEEKEPVEFK